MGGIQSRADYAAILDRMDEVLGDERARRFHVHFSRIEFSVGGEKRHWTFAETQFGPEPQPLMELLAERREAPERARPVRQDSYPAISSLFVRAKLSRRLQFFGSVLALSGASRQLSQRESLQRLYPTLFVIFIVFFTETPCQMARDWVK